MKRMGWKHRMAVGALTLALAGCAQPSDFALRGVAMPGADDENHPAAMRDVADARPTTVGATLNALFSFPDSDGR